MRKVLVRLINGVFVAVVGFIFLSYLLGNRISYYRGAKFYGVVLLALSLGLSFASVWLYKKFMKSKFTLKKRTEILLVAALMALYLCISVFIAANFAVTQDGWDPGQVFGLAKMIARGEGLEEGKRYYYYFSIYPFQVFSAYVDGVYLKIMHHFTSVDDLVLVIMLNIFYVNGAILFTYLTARKLFGMKPAIFLLAAVPLFAPVLLYVPVKYTDTSSLFFLMGAAYFAAIFMQNKRGRALGAVEALLFALFMTLAILFKVTCAIFMIALAIYFFTKKRFEWKKLGVLVAAMILVFIPTKLCVDGFVSKRVDAHLELPKLHWVYMGMYYDGRFNGVPHSFTQEVIARGEDPKAALREVIADKIHERGVAGFFDLWITKVSYTWCEGDYYAFEKLSRFPVNYLPVYNKVMDDYHSEICFLLDMIILSRYMIFLWMGLKTRKKGGFALVLKMALIGAFMFFLVWETRSRYILNYLPLHLILWVYGLKVIADATNHKKAPIKRAVK